MGCMGSKPASPAEQQEMCQEACKLVMTAILPATLDNPSAIKIKAPQAQLASIQQMIDNLRTAAAEAKTKLAAPGKGAAEGLGKLSVSAGGALGGLLSKAAKAVDSVSGAAAEIAGAGLEQLFNDMATEMARQMEILNGKFDDVGKDFLEKNKADVSAAYTQAISACAFDNAPNLCKKDGDTAISNRFGSMMTADLSKTLASHVKTAAGLGVVAAWDQSTGVYNSANDKLGATEWTSKFKQEPITLDISQYIAEQMLMQVQEVMGPREVESRKNAQSDKFLSVCLSKEPISKIAYDAFKTEGRI